MSMTDRQQAYVERFGRFWEVAGGPRTAGRIVGWLMISDPPQQSAAELVAALGVSHGSVSTLTRQLDRANMVERITFPGDRASYYRLREHVWVNLIDSRMDGLIELRELGSHGAELSTSTTDRGTELQLVAEFLLERWPGLIEELRRRMSVSSE